MRELGLFFDGQWQSAEGGRVTDSINPCTEEPWAKVAAASRGDADKAIASAKRAFPQWRDSSRAERATVMEAVADALFDRQEELAEAEVTDGGTTITKATTADVPFTAQCFLHFAEMLRQSPGEQEFEEDVPVASRNLIVEEPYGVCAGIVPWNFPMAGAAMKIAPALAAGNSYVLKPSPHTPVTALLLAEIIQQAGAPKGLVNVVAAPENELGEVLTTHPDVAKVSFTGSTRIGSEVMRKCADTVKPVTLELGGKSPSVILEDADMEAAARGVLFGTFFHAGQVCTSGTRVLVPKALYGQFLERMVDEAKGIVLGDPAAYETTMGPLCFEAHRDNVERYVGLGKGAGARCVIGGERPPGRDVGYFYSPTIFADVDNAMQVAQEEIFGPVVCVIPYEGGDEGAVAMANDISYGLAASIWSRDLARAEKMARRIDAGTVWINDYHLLNVRFPFGGFKMSGFGRELGPWGYEEYRRVKHIHVGQPGPAEEKFYVEMLLGEK